MTYPRSHREQAVALTVGPFSARHQSPCLPSTESSDTLLSLLIDQVPGGLVGRGCPGILLHHSMALRLGGRHSYCGEKIAPAEVWMRGSVPRREASQERSISCPFALPLAIQLPPSPSPGSGQERRCRNVVCASAERDA